MTPFHLVAAALVGAFVLIEMLEPGEKKETQPKKTVDEKADREAIERLKKERKAEEKAPREANEKIERQAAEKLEKETEEIAALEKKKETENKDDDENPGQTDE